MDLHLEQVSYIYPQTNRGIRSVSATLPPGGWTALIGQSGSGKTTLLRIMAQLISPQSGHITNTDKKRPGLVMQFPEHHFFCTTVQDEIAFSLQRAGLSRNEIDERITLALEAVGLDNTIVNESPFHLDGGAQRLVAIAVILALQPSILLLDEPAAGLDAQQRDDLFQRIDAWRKKTNATVLISSHDMDEVARWAEHLLILNEGTLVYAGDMEAEPFRQAATWGIGVPTGVQFLLSLQQLGGPEAQFARTAHHATNQIMSFLSQHITHDDRGGE